MRMKIYVDVVFLTDWVMNGCVVLLTAGITCTPVRPGRTAGAAAVGALVHMGLLFFFWQAGGKSWRVVSFLISLMLIPVMTAIAFPCPEKNGKRTFQELAGLWTAFAGAAFLLSGALQLLQPFWRRMFFRFWLAAAVAYGMLQAGIHTVEAVRRRRRDLCRVRLYIGDRECRVTALLDSGNRLHDPWLHRPVSILEEKALPFPVTGSLAESLKLHFIPYQSVGCPSGMLTGLVFTRMVIEGEKGERVVQAPVIGISKNTLSAEKAYQMILNEKFRQ